MTAGAHSLADALEMVLTGETVTDVAEYAAKALRATAVEENELTSIMVRALHSPFEKFKANEVSMALQQRKAYLDQKLQYDDLYTQYRKVIKEGDATEWIRQQQKRVRGRRKGARKFTHQDALSAEKEQLEADLEEILPSLERAAQDLVEMVYIIKEKQNSEITVYMKQYEDRCSQYLESARKQNGPQIFSC